MSAISTAIRPVTQIMEYQPQLVDLAETTTFIKPLDTVKLLTLNTWGLKYISKHRTERLREIANRLASDNEKDDYDIVALQEVWTEEDWNYISSVCSYKYPYRRIFSAGIVSGPGLAILSKIPIKRTFLHVFPINGRPSAFFRGDWYVGKSVAVTLLQPTSNEASPIALLNSHMHAPYALSGDAAYSTHRACQAWEIANLATDLSDAGYAVILVGDLNSKPGSLPYRIIQHEANLKDSWEVLNGVMDLNSVKRMNPYDQVLKGATTCDSVLNTWRATRDPSEACRLDYALIDDSKLTPIDASVEFYEKIPGIGSYSDHFGYSATFQVLPKSFQQERFPASLNEKFLVYEDLKSLVLEYLQTTNKWQYKWRMAHFSISMLICAILLPTITISSFVAPWATSLLFLLGVFIAVGGVINGLIGFLFTSGEKRLLREVVFQINDRFTYMKTTKFNIRH